MQLPKRNAMVLKSCTRSRRDFNDTVANFLSSKERLCDHFTRVVSGCWGWIEFAIRMWNWSWGERFRRFRRGKDFGRLWLIIIRFYIIFFYDVQSIGFKFNWIYEINIWEMRICIESLIWNNIFNSFLTVFII